MEKKSHINLEFILSALAALCAILSLAINIFGFGVSSAAIVTSALWLVFAAMLPIFFVTGNKLFLRLSLILGAALRAASVVNTIIQSIGEAAFALGRMYYLIQLTSLLMFVIMAVSVCLKEGKAVSVLLKIGAIVILTINVLMLVLMLSTLGYYHTALKLYFILSYTADIFFAAAVGLYAFRSFAEKKRESYKRAQEALRALKIRLENGEITNQEYTARKKEILKNM